MKLRVPTFIFQLFKANTVTKCVLTVLRLNWNQPFWGKQAKLNIFHHMFTSPHNCKCSGKNEKVCEMSKNKKMPVQSVQNYNFSLSNMQICDNVVVVVDTTWKRYIASLVRRNSRGLLEGKKKTTNSTPYLRNRLSL